MSNTYTSSTWTLSGSASPMTVSTEERREERPKPPKGLIATHAVPMKEGWIGQVWVDKTIVWEAAPEEDPDDAMEAANTCVVNVIKNLFINLEAKELETGIPTHSDFTDTDG